MQAGIIQEALVEVIGCTGMTHSAAMAGQILHGRTLLEALNTDVVCDAINVAKRPWSRCSTIWMAFPKPGIRGNSRTQGTTCG